MALPNWTLPNWTLPSWDWAAADPFDLDGSDFLALYAALMVLVAMLTWLLRDVARTSDRRPDLRDLGDVELAYCVGGDERAADTLYVALAARGVAGLGRNSLGVDCISVDCIIVVDDPVAGLPPQLEAFRHAIVGSRSRERFLAAFTDSSPYEAMLDRLLARKILLDPARRARLDRATWLPSTLLLASGLAKVCVGLLRGEPVGFLLLFMATTLVALVAAMGRERYLTREAQGSLDALRQSRSRVLKAPRPDELPFAFAMLGTVALAGTAHAGYARLVKPQDGGNTGGGSS